MADSKTVLVTGAAGALARRVIHRLHDTGHKVVAVVSPRKADPAAGIPSFKVEMHKRGFEDVFSGNHIDAVIHIGRIFTHEQDTSRRYNSNVLGTRRLLELG